MSYFAKFKSFFWFLMKLALAGGIVFYLVFNNPTEIVDCFKNFNYIWLVPALLAYLFHILVCAWRWHRLTRILQVQLSWFEALSLTMQGFFFSLVIPGGAIGGDVVKMGVLSRRSPPGTKVEGAFTILMDRIVGMIALFILALLLLIPSIPVLMKIDVPNFAIDDRMRILFIFGLAGLCLAGLVCSSIIFFHRTIEKLPLAGRLINWADHISHGMVRRLTSAVDVYIGSWLELGKLTIISVFLVHIMTVISFTFLMIGLGLQVSFLTLLIAVTVGNIVGLIPLFPAGVGGRDVAIVTILVAGSVSVGDAKTGQLLYTAIVLFFNLISGLFFIFDRGRVNAEITG